MQVPIASEVTTGGLRLIDKEVNGGNFLEGIGFLVSRVTFYLLKVNIDMCKVLDPCSIFHVHFPWEHIIWSVDLIQVQIALEVTIGGLRIVKEGIQHHAVSIFEKAGN